MAIQKGRTKDQKKEITMPLNIADSTVELCISFRVGSPELTFLYPKEICEENTESPVYIWTTSSSEAKVWHSCNDPQLVRVMAKYPAAEMFYLARLRPVEPRPYSRDFEVIRCSSSYRERRTQNRMF